MSHGLALDSKPLALELHALLKDLDPASLDPASLDPASLDPASEIVEPTLRQRAASLAERMAKLLHDSAANTPLGQRLSTLATLLREHLPRRDMPREAWTRYRTQLQTAYEELSASLRESQVHLPTLRPTNYVRSAFHVAIAVVLVVLVQEVLTPFWRAAVPTAFAVFFWTLEGLRHFSENARKFLLWLFRAIAHPHERYRVNSSTWFTTALALLGLFFDPTAACIAIIVLGTADPAAGFVGRKFGKTKLVGNRSLQGTLTFVAVGTIAALAVLAIWQRHLGVGTMLAASALGACFGALAELFSGRLDDNFTIPLSAGTGAWLALWLAGA